MSKSQIQIFVILLILIASGIFAYQASQSWFYYEEKTILSLNESNNLKEKIIVREKITPFLSKDKIKTVINLGGQTEDSLNALIQNSKKYQKVNDRIDYISERFLGTSYQADTLIGSQDLTEQFVVNLESVDCFTFVDYILALAISDNFVDFYDKLQAIRYKSGQIDYRTRNHFFSQWIDNNSEHLFDVSNRFEESVCTVKELNKKENGRYWVEGIPFFEKNVCYLPREVILNQPLDSIFRNGDIVGLYTDLKGLDVSHLGIISIQSSGIYLRHASFKTKKVIDSNLEDFLTEKKELKGLIIIRTQN